MRTLEPSNLNGLVVSKREDLQVDTQVLAAEQRYMWALRGTDRCALALCGEDTSGAGLGLGLQLWLRCLGTTQSLPHQQLFLPEGDSLGDSSRATKEC